LLLVRGAEHADVVKDLDPDVVVDVNGGGIVETGGA